MTTTSPVSVDEQTASLLTMVFDFRIRSAEQSRATSRIHTVSDEKARARALGGKHLRSKSVHISAGEVTAEQLDAAAVFGTWVGLRRGESTIHARMREHDADAQVSTSGAIVADTLGTKSAPRLLRESTLDDAVLRRVLLLITSAAHETFIGEIFDIGQALGRAYQAAGDILQGRCILGTTRFGENGCTDPARVTAVGERADLSPSIRSSLRAVTGRKIKDAA